MKNEQHEAPVTGLGAESEREMMERQTAVFSAVMFDVLKEVTRGQIKHGIQDRPAFEWQMILTEEHGEYAREVCIAYFEGREFGAFIRKELVETAAVALRAIRNYDERLARQAPKYPRIAAGPGTQYPGPTELAAQIRTESDKPYTLCEKDGSKCFLNHCDTNGCNERKRATLAAMPVLTPKNCPNNAAGCFCNGPGCELSEKLPLKPGKIDFTPEEFETECPNGPAE